MTRELSLAIRVESFGIDGVLALILIAVEAAVIVRYRKKLAAK